MANIIPFQAWHYHPILWPSLKNLVAPLADNLSDKEIKHLFQNPRNSIHLTPISIKLETDHAAKKLSEWKSKNILVQDTSPGIYVFYQNYKFKGETYCLKGFVALIDLRDSKAILRHEDTLDTPVKNQVKLLKQTQLQPNPTHGLYEDPSFRLEPLMDQAMSSPLFEFENQDGVKESIAVINDPQSIAKFIQVMESQTIILADGHHRLEGAIAHQKLLQPQTGASKNEAFNYHMMYFTNGSSNQLKILPTHRLFRNLEIAQEDIVTRLEKFFNIKKLNSPRDINNFPLVTNWSFLLLFKEAAYFVQLRPESFRAFPTKSPEAVKNLDLSVLHHFFVEQILGIPKMKQTNSDKISYERDMEQCFKQVKSGKATLAVFTREISIQEVIAVCKSGSTMPQKSTYFYPKTLTGLLFYSIEQKDINFPYI
ncbi:DUF1015 domain-containing protein [Echinicola jeungdonensis]|uniref:DUF1015 domain-containing protein n=1 Tax=Echinicola jeungdonensis TaxID=709343 RepID=A0ABV5J4U7_9BACT|nr:DUF1015 domain-containing protein [Echinicola jeungdonensis]MDN3668017.1 DUF1015 domain-containing protein [Echinicola jeungdonensis]